MKLTNDEGASAKLRRLQHLNNEMGWILGEISDRAKIPGGRRFRRVSGAVADCSLRTDGVPHQ
jgi:hypothetical protein